MATVVSPGSNLPLPVGVSSGQQFLTNHLIRFRSGLGDQPNGLGGPINFAHEIPNRSPRNVFTDISDQYTEFGLRRYRCYYLFNSHYTLAIPNIVAYIKEGSQNAKSRISFSFGLAGFNGTEQTIQSQFHDPVGIKWNSAQARIEASFLREPLKPRNWIGFWIREILDFGAENTEFNYYAVRIETSDPVAVLGQPDFNMAYVGNMGCDANSFGKVWGKIKGRNPTSIFTLGNNSYQNTGECWLNTISSMRDRVKMTFGAWDWYIGSLADKLDDASFPRVPDDWYWPVPENACDTARYNCEELIEIKKEEPEQVDEDALKPPPYWDVHVWDEAPEGGCAKGDHIEETFGPFWTEQNAQAYATWLRTCEIITSEINIEKFNVTLQNRYRSYFGITNFDGYQSFYANNIHFLILNTNAVSLGHTEESPQYRFAEEQLKRAVDNAFIDWRIVIGYRPGNVAPNDSMRTVLQPDGTTQLGVTGYQGPIRQFNELYKPLFEKYNVTLYINGNVNNYQRSGILKFDSGNWIEPTEQANTTGPDYKLKGRSLDGGGIIYLTVGAGGQRLQPNEGLPSWIKKSFQQYGYVNMTSLKNGQFLQFRYYDINDNLLDYFSVGKEAFVFVPTPPAGNQPPATVNPFGIRQIYTKKSGGDEWASTAWGNGNPREIPGGCASDPAAPEFKHRDNSGSVCTIDGEGVCRLTIDGRAAILGTYQNVEMTVYVRAPPAMAADGITHLQPKTEHYCIGGNDLFGGYVIYVDYHDQSVYFKKEQSHNIGYTPRMEEQPTTLLADRWYGLRMAVYNIGSTVKVECYKDDTNGLNGGDWKKITEWIDDGTEEIDGTAYPAVTGVVRSAAIRTDAQGSGSYFDYKWLTVREINPPSQIPPPTPGPVPPGSEGTGQLENGVMMQFPRIGTAETFRFSSSTAGRSQWVADLPHCFVNLEVTGYLFIHDVDNNSEEVSIKVRGGPHTDDNNDWGSCYIIGIGYDGSVNSQYEEPHPNNHPMDFDEVTNDPLDGDAVGKWFGIKAICYEDGNHDKIECWIDPGGLDGSGKPKNEWVKFWETTSNQFTGECNGDGDNERVYFRMDDVSGDEEDAVDVKFATAREIDPKKRFT